MSLDYGENLVKATYDLEGDGPLIFHCFEIIDTLCIAIKRLDGRSLNAEAVANDLSKGSLTYKKSLIEYARTWYHLFLPAASKFHCKLLKQEGCFLQ